MIKNKTHTNIYTLKKFLGKQMELFYKTLILQWKPVPPGRVQRSFPFLGSSGKWQSSFLQKRQGSGHGGGGWEEHTLYEGSLKSLSSQMLGQTSSLVELSSSHTHMLVQFTSREGTSGETPRIFSSAGIISLMYANENRLALKLRKGVTDFSQLHG